MHIELVTHTVPFHQHVYNQLLCPPVLAEPSWQLSNPDQSYHLLSPFPGCIQDSPQCLSLTFSVPRSVPLPNTTMPIKLLISKTQETSHLPICLTSGYSKYDGGSSIHITQELVKKWRIWGPTPDLLNQDLHFNKSHMHIKVWEALVLSY